MKNLRESISGQARLDQRRDDEALRFRVCSMMEEDMAAGDSSVNILIEQRRNIMKLGLVLEGGASRGHFSNGVMDSLLAAGLIADYIIGTSAGIAYGISYASGQQGRNHRIALEYMHDKRYMGIRHLLNPRNRSYYNLDFVFRDIPQQLVPFDYDAFSAFRGDVVAVLTNMETGRVEYVDVPKDDREFRVVRASCALPLVFPAVTIGGKKYMDGGIVVPIPVDQAMKAGCDKIIVVLTREREYQKPREKSLWVARKVYRKYPRFAEALSKRQERYNQLLGHVKNLEEEGGIFVFAPHMTKGIGRTESRPEVLASLYNQGRDIFVEKLPALLNYLAK